MLTTKWIYLTFVVLAIQDGAKVLLARADDDPADEDGGRFEPPFPALFYDSVSGGSIWPQRAKIVTEVTGGAFRRTNVEYIDLDAGKAAFVLQNGQSGAASQVLLSDVELDKLLKYQPYTCESYAPEQFKSDDLDHWSSVLEHGNGVPTRQLRLFGLAAMWMYAGESAKTYSHGAAVYNIGQDLYRMVHNWTLIDDSLDVFIRFSFASATFNKKSRSEKGMMKQMRNELGLELVEVCDKSSKLLRTIKVLSVEYSLNLDDYADILRVPVGYGCVIKSGTGEPTEEALEESREFFSKYLFHSAKINLEATATKIDTQRSTDTLYVELAHLTLDMSDSAHKYDLMMSKVRSASEEVKTVENHLFSVKYQIDLLRASCSMSHINPSALADDGGQLLVSLKFANGLELALDREGLKRLFATGTEDFQNYVASERLSDGAGNSRRNIYIEKALPEWRSNPSSAAHPVSLIRGYVEETTSDQLIFRLASVTIWVFADASRARIQEIYQLNLINQEGPLSAWPHVAELFDVSQECYLDNEQMRAGTDYAWVEFFYPLASRQLDLLVEVEEEIKWKMYNLLGHQYWLTSARVARFELMFSDEGLVARALLLDLPDIPLLYEARANTLIVFHKDKGDLEFMAPDLRHCSKLCQQYRCKSMSYCLATRSCLLGMRPLNPANSTARPGDPAQALESNQDCITYGAVERLEGHMDSAEFKYRLTDLLGMLSHLDYDTRDVPQAPEELTLPRDEAGFASENEYREALSAYATQVSEYINGKGQTFRTLMLTLIVDGQLLFLVPSSFLLENDPLEGFGLSVDGQEAGQAGDVLYDSQKVAAFFHEGLPMSRFKFNSFQGELRDKSSLLSGIAYDQCALGCLDSRCGTFSYCASRKECILTSFDTLTEAAASKLIEVDSDCFVSQRDFAKNYQKYPGCERPNGSLAASTAESVSDCALACLRSGEPSCMSFEFCQAQPGDGHNCFLQRLRQPDGLFAARQPANAAKRPQSNGSALVVQPNTGCDHYERSYLAEFSLIESRLVSSQLLDRLKTSEFLDTATPMECADVCLNHLNDCTAFQFCFDPSPASTRASQESFKYSHSCLTIQSGPLEAEERKDFEALIEPGSDSLAAPNKYLDFNRFCNVYALRPDTVQAHLRDLAMGSTMSAAERRRLEQQNGRAGFHMLWTQYLFISLALALCSALFGMAICYAYEKNHYVRAHLDRLHYRAGQVRSRLHLWCNTMQSPS